MVLGEKRAPHTMRRHVCGGHAPCAHLYPSSGPTGIRSRYDERVFLKTYAANGRACAEAAGRGQCMCIPRNMHRELSFGQALMPRTSVVTLCTDPSRPRGVRVEVDGVLVESLDESVRRGGALGIGGRLWAGLVNG